MDAAQGFSSVFSGRKALPMRLNTAGKHPAESNRPPETAA
jgi:hypothetical protein